MPDIAALASFALAALLIQAIPGPGMLFLIAQAASHGPRAGVAASLGAASGMVVHTAAVAAGLGIVFVHAPGAYHVLRIAGGLYLLWLGVCTFRSAGGRQDEPIEREPSLRRIFLRSLLNNLANPKVILFFLAFLPQFVVAGGAPAALQLATLGGVFLLIGLAIDLPLGALAGRAGAAIRRSDRLQRALDRVAGAVLAGLGVRVLLDSRR